ncbi:MAG: DUF1722 domain-containing protein [Candidatus Schekmanbacteria bacterium]|nr:MAG: DUF1722 domain-containing protein [Candidatus Schekmanbacteria bacterium]
MRYIKPTILISKCLGFDACRYNGKLIYDPFIEKLRKYVDFIPLCPEVEIGLGVPRKPLKVVIENGKKKLYQIESKKHYTRKLRAFSNKNAKVFANIDGAILKSRSPSCGLRDVKIYSSAYDSIPISKGSGLFAEYLLKMNPAIPCEDERRLNNIRIREFFLIRIHLSSLFRTVKKKASIHSLTKFHNEYKLLFLLYNESRVRKLDRIIEKAEKKSVKSVNSSYEAVMNELLSHRPTYNSWCKVFSYSFVFVSDKLSSQEKKNFLELIERLKKREISLSVPRALLYQWAIRFDEKNLLNQRVLRPYPPSLDQIDI